MTRYEIPQAVANVLEMSVGLGLADALDLVALGITHGGDWHALLAELTEWNAARALQPELRDRCARVTRAIDAAYGALRATA